MRPLTSFFRDEKTTKVPCHERALDLCDDTPPKIVTVHERTFDFRVLKTNQ